MVQQFYVIYNFMFCKNLTVIRECNRRIFYLKKIERSFQSNPIVFSDLLSFQKI